MRNLRLPISVFLLALFSASALGIEYYCAYWYWMWKPAERLPGDQFYDERLTSNNGAHAVSMTKYGSPDSVWVNVVSEDRTGWPAVCAHQYDDFDGQGLHFRDTTTIKRSDDKPYWDVGVSAVNGQGGRKVVTFLWGDDDSPYIISACADALRNIGRPWPNFTELNGICNNSGASSAVVMEDELYGCAVFTYHFTDPAQVNHPGLMAAWTTTGGDAWNTTWVREAVENGPLLSQPSICKGTNGALHLAYLSSTAGVDTIMYCPGSNHGMDWGESVPLDVSLGARQPCIACIADTVVVCWTRDAEGESRIYYTWSTDGGDTWPNGVNEVPLEYSDANGPIRYSRPNISMVLTGGRPTVVMVCAVNKYRTDPIPDVSSVTAAFGKYGSSRVCVGSLMG